MDVRFADDPAKYPDRVKFLWRPDRSLWDARPMPNYAELPEAERRLREARVREGGQILAQTSRIHSTRTFSRKEPLRVY